MFGFLNNIFDLNGDGKIDIFENAFAFGVLFDDDNDDEKNDDLDDLDIFDDELLDDDDDFDDLDIFD